MFIKEKIFKKKLKSLCTYVFNRLENNGNATFDTNGEKHFVDELFRYFVQLKIEKPLIFDVGANVGHYTQMLTEYKNKNSQNVNIHCFEPTASCFQDLENRFKNQLYIKLTNKALSDKKEDLTIFYNVPKSGLASLYQRNLDAINIKMDQSEKIEAIRADEYINDNNIKHIHFMKIDIEGHELAAFNGLGKYLNSEFIDFIQFEYGGANLDSKTTLFDLYSLLKSKGFLIAKIMPGGIQIRDYQYWMENFNYANYVAISNKIKPN